MTKGKNWNDFLDLICNKWYYIEYVNAEGDRDGWIYGYMLNYAAGDIVCVNENGIYHIPYDYIIYIVPVNDDEFLKDLDDSLKTSDSLN